MLVCQLIIPRHEMQSCLKHSHEESCHAEVLQKQNARLILPKLQVYIHTTLMCTQQEIYRAEDQRGNWPSNLYLDLKIFRTPKYLALKELSVFSIHQTLKKCSSFCSIPNFGLIRINLNKTQYLRNPAVLHMVTTFKIRTMQNPNTFTLYLILCSFFFHF